MNLEKTLISFIEKNLLDNQFLVDLKVSSGATKISVAVDTEEGILIDACGKISRKLGDYIEEEELIEGAYILEVSSPGLDQPLLRIEQYKKNIEENLINNIVEEITIFLNS